MKKGFKVFCLCLAAVGVAGACVGVVYGGNALASRSSSTDVCGLPDSSKWIVGMSKTYSGSVVSMGVYRIKYHNGAPIRGPRSNFWSSVLSFPSAYSVAVPGQSSDLCFFDLRAFAEASHKWIEPSVSDLGEDHRWSIGLSILGSDAQRYSASASDIVEGPGIYLLSFGAQIDSTTADSVLSHSDYPLCAGEVSK